MKEESVLVNAFDDGEEDDDSEDEGEQWDFAVVDETVRRIFYVRDWKKRLEEYKVEAKKLHSKTGFIIDRSCDAGRRFWRKVGEKEAERLTCDDEVVNGEGKRRGQHGEVAEKDSSKKTRWGKKRLKT